MDLAANVAALALGLVLLGLVFWDLFQTIIVPRPTPGVFRISRYFVRGSWRLVRAIGRRGPNGSRDTLLGLFAPAATVALMAVWLAVMVLGFGLVLFAMRNDLQPVPADLGTTVYFAASSILTLGSADVVATGEAARLVVILAAVSGLGAVALGVTFLFSLYGSYQRREIQVVALQAVAGAPPSAVALLEAYARLDLVSRLPDLFVEWQRWSAEVLDSHVAYPLLGFFRSSHDSLSWLSALGTVLDAASLVMTTICDLPRGEAELTKRMGAHLAEDMSNLGFRDGEPDDIDREAFDAACVRLAAAGYALEPADQAWAAFQAKRATYAPRLESMAAYWATSATSWLGTGGKARSAAHRSVDASANPTMPA